MDSDNVEIRPYGTWESPITIDDLYKASTSKDELYVDEQAQEIFHVESRPHEAGRSVLCRSLPPYRDLIPADINARTRVHEYGGAATVVKAGWAWVSDFKSGRVYRVDTSGSKEAKAVTSESDVYRYADFNIHPTQPHLALAIREDHTIDLPAQVVNTLVLIDAEKEQVTVLKEGNDFYACPRFNGDGSKCAWIEWSHPDMPWEGTKLYHSDFSQSELKNVTYVAGEKGEIAVNQPVWSDNRLFFLSDQTGYHNLWQIDTGRQDATPEPATKRLEYDFGNPMWQLGISDYTILSPKIAIVRPIIDSRTSLSRLDLESQTITPLKGGEIYVEVQQLKRLSDTQAVFIGSRGDQKPTLVLVTIGSTGAEFKEIQTNAPQTGAKKLDPKYISHAETHTLRIPWEKKAVRPKGMKEGDVDLHVNLFLPTNPKFMAPEGTAPPCLVGVHGGPTSRATPTFVASNQYYTTRGYAVLDVNYGGSSGYGREYMLRLADNWGLLDSSDTIQAVIKLAQMGKIDGERVAIRGGSAGGLTVLTSLADSDIYSAGISSYGVAELNLLAADTHKFESQYLFKLVGGRPEEVPKVYHDRSPIFRAEKIKAALLVFHGEDDKVVPPAQARELVKKVEAAYGNVEAVFYEGEGHGFRKLENLKDSMRRSEEFYKKVFKLD